MFLITSCHLLMGGSVVIDYYGERLSVSYEESFAYDKGDIKGYLKAVKEEDRKAFRKQLEKYKKAYKLNDYYYYVLVTKVVDAIFLILQLIKRVCTFGMCFYKRVSNISL